MRQGISKFWGSLIFFFLYSPCIYSANIGGAVYDYVGKSQGEIDFGVNNKNSKVQVGKSEYLYIREDFHSTNANAIQSLVTNFDYDQSIFAVHWLPPECNHNNDVIKCNRPKLSFNQLHSVYFILKPLNSISYGNVLVGKSNAIVLSDNEESIINGLLLYVDIIEKAACGDAAKFYASSITSYPIEAKFCTNGIPYPSSPMFPKMKTTVTWTCKSDLGNIDCEARRGYPKVDYSINKYVGYNQEDTSNRKSALKVTAGEEMAFKLVYENLPISEDVPKDCQLIDFFDKRLFEVIDYPSACNIHENKLICQCDTLDASQSHMLYYRVRVKKDFHEHVLLEIKSMIDIDNDVDDSNNSSSVKVEIN